MDKVEVLLPVEHLDAIMVIPIAGNNLLTIV